jgi:hypothetical protein
MSELPGLVPRKTFGASLNPPRSEFTVRRWEREGRIVVRRIGRVAFVDLDATAARMRGEDQLRPRRRLPKVEGRR